jgi:hypothetical protein
MWKPAASRSSARRGDADARTSRMSNDKIAPRDDAAYRSGVAARPSRKSCGRHRCRQERSTLRGVRPSAPRWLVVSAVRLEDGVLLVEAQTTQWAGGHHARDAHDPRRPAVDAWAPTSFARSDCEHERSGHRQRRSLPRPASSRDR